MMDAPSPSRGHPSPPSRSYEAARAMEALKMNCVQQSLPVPIQRIQAPSATTTPPPHYTTPLHPFPGQVAAASTNLSVTGRTTQPVVDSTTDQRQRKKRRTDIAIRKFSAQQWKGMLLAYFAACRQGPNRPSISSYCLHVLHDRNLRHNFTRKWELSGLPQLLDADKEPNHPDVIECAKKWVESQDPEIKRNQRYHEQRDNQEVLPSRDSTLGDPQTATLTNLPLGRDTLTDTDNQPGRRSQSSTLCASQTGNHGQRKKSLPDSSGEQHDATALYPRQPRKKRRTDIAVRKFSGNQWKEMLLGYYKACLREPTRPSICSYCINVLQDRNLRHNFSIKWEQCGLLALLDAGKPPNHPDVLICAEKWALLQSTGKVVAKHRKQRALALKYLQNVGVHESVKAKTKGSPLLNEVVIVCFAINKYTVLNQQGVLLNGCTAEEVVDSWDLILPKDLSTWEMGDVTEAAETGHLEQQVNHAVALHLGREMHRKYVHEVAQKSVQYSTPLDSIFDAATQPFQSTVILPSGIQYSYFSSYHNQATCS